MYRHRIRYTAVSSNGTTGTETRLTVIYIESGQLLHGLAVLGVALAERGHRGGVGRGGGGRRGGAERVITVHGGVVRHNELIPRVIQVRVQLAIRRQARLILQVALHLQAIL